MKIYENIQQGSPEWLSLRAGKFTASQVHKLMGKSETTQTATTYIYKVAAEKLSHIVDTEIPTKAMQWGSDNEPIAREIYSKIFNEPIKQVGFVTPDHTAEYGVSPDGIIENLERGIEIKCPLSIENHMLNLTIDNQEQLKSEWPQYYWQIQMCLFVCDYISWDFISFHPLFPENYMLCALNVRRNEADISLLRKRLDFAVTARDTIVDKVRRSVVTS